jgi:hypothetical protein
MPSRTRRTSSWSDILRRGRFRCDTKRNVPHSTPSTMGYHKVASSAPSFIQYLQRNYQQLNRCLQRPRSMIQRSLPHTTTQSLLPKNYDVIWVGLNSG